MPQPAAPEPAAPGPAEAAAGPALGSQPVPLREQHLAALRQALLAACTLPDLEALARFTYDTSLDTLVPTQGRTLTQVAGDLVDWAAQHATDPPGPGTGQLSTGVQGLLAAALHQVPANPDLLALHAAWQGITFTIEYECPYPGMKPFSRQERDRFYGRDAEIEEAIQRLQIDPTLVVIGPSGSGKSSLVLAGILPAMQGRKTFGGKQLAVRVMRPGADPLAALAAVFGCAPAPSTPTALSACVRQQLTGGDHPTPTVLVVDQLEEAFTLAPAAARAALGETLAQLDAIDRLWIILTVRADFYPELMASDLWPEIERRRLEVVPLRGEALRAAIVEPANQAGVNVDEALTRQLIADAAGEPGVLPFLQETLRLLWDHLDGRRLTLDAYRQVAGDTGSGASGDGAKSALYVALARQADDAYGRLDTAEQAIARRTLLRLVQFNEGRANTRRQLGEDELMAAEDNPATFAKVIGLLVDRRLLTASSSPTAGQAGQKPESQARRLDIAHEALLSGWPRLRQWMDEHRLDELVHRRITDDAEEWERNGRRSSYLYEGDRLAEADRWAKTHPDAVNDLDLRFLGAGRQRRLRSVATLAAAGLAVLLLAAFAGLAVTGTLNRLLYRPPTPQWVAIPGDKFLMGSTPDEVLAADALDPADLAEQPDVLGYDFGAEQPAHWVALSPYDIMRYEVTRREYHQCQRAGVCDAASPPLAETGVDGDLPVTTITPDDAARFCAFIGGHVPTEAQWELAARGPGSRHKLYPWGDDPDPARANVKTGQLQPVGAYPTGASEYGVEDLAGNAWEWVSDAFAPYRDFVPSVTASDATAPLVDPTGPAGGHALLVRGGSYQNDWVKARSASRLVTLERWRTGEDVGFRCVR